MGRRKRSRREFEESQQASNNYIGMGQTLSALRGEQASVDGRDEDDNSVTDRSAREGDQLLDEEEQAGKEKSEEPWETVERRSSKKQKKNNYPAITHSAHARLQTHVKISDLQALVLYILADGPAPQWVAVRHHGSIRKVVAVMVPGLESGMFTGDVRLDAGRAATEAQVDGDEASTTENGTKKRLSCPKSHVSHTTNGHKPSLSPDDYYPVKLIGEELPEPLKPLADMFPHVWPIKTPGDDRFSKIHSPLQAMLISPLPKPKEEKKSKGVQPPREAKLWQNKSTPVTNFVASLDELHENEFPIHPAYARSLPELADRLAQDQGRKMASGPGWVASRADSIEDGDVPEEIIEKGSITAGRKIISMDCEMCKTEGDRFDVTRISLVAWDGSVIMDELVKPDKAITDYLTRYSGITEDMLKPVTTTLQDIQARLLDLFDSKTILVGHSLESDLKSLKLSHPFIADTSILYPHPRGAPLKSSLKWLAQKYLGREIQKHDGSTGHDSVEDARACLDLLKQKCEKGSKWGTSEASGESIFKRLSRSQRPKNMKTGAASDEFRTSAIVDWGDPRRGLGATADVSISCENDSDVVDGVRSALHGDTSAEGAPGAGVDFIWARLRGLEAVRGWWNRAKTVDNAEMLAAAQAEGHSAVAADEASAAADDSNGTATSSSEDDADARTLAGAVAKTVAHLHAMYAALPPCTAFIVYSGSGDPREAARLQAVQRQFRSEFAVKKWDELSVRWTDVEDRALRDACKKARDGIGFVVVK